MTREIPLTQGKVALVDDADFDWLSQWAWHAARQGRMEFCAIRSSPRKNGSQRTIYMHRLIMGEPVGLVIDHINHDPLDNRRVNLRVCEHKQNMRNRVANSRSTSKYLGVDWYRRTNKWRAQIKVDGRKTNLGYFDNEHDAARAYDDAARLHFGDFANPNFKELNA